MGLLVSRADIDGQQEALSQAGSLRIRKLVNVDTGVVPVPEETIRNTLISNQVNDSTRHDTWLERNPDQFPCPMGDVNSMEGE